MKLTEGQLRRIIRKELMREFFGLFGDDAGDLPVDNYGHVRISKLAPEQQDLYIKVKNAVRKSGDPKSIVPILQSAGVDRTGEHKNLISKAIEAGKISFGHDHMAM